MARARVALLVLVACAVWGAPAASASFILTAPEQAEAIRTGQRSVTTETFAGEWWSSSQAGDVTAMTPFLRLALAARPAAFNQNPIARVDVDKVPRQDRAPP